MVYYVKTFFLFFLIQVFKTVKDDFFGGRSKNHVAREGSAQGYLKSIILWWNAHFSDCRYLSNI